MKVDPLYSRTAQMTLAPQEYFHGSANAHPQGALSQR